MQENKSAVKNIGAYDDYEGVMTEADTEGLFSPFTFLCFTVILVLFGAVTLLSASYDTALRENRAFYSLFLKEVGALAIGLSIGTSLCFLPQKIIRRLHFFLLPVYLILFVLSVSLNHYTPSFMYTSLMGLVGTLTLLFLYSDIVPRFLSHERKGLSLIGVVITSAFILISETEICGTGWYIVSFLVIIASLLSLKVKRSYVLYFAIVMTVLLVFLVLTSEKLLSSFSEALFSYPDSSYYKSSRYLAGEAISEGGFIGVGIGNGLYKLGLIDDIEGEYIYASLSEETGMLGTIIIVFCALMIMLIGLRSSSRAYRKKEYFISAVTLSGAVVVSFVPLINMFYVSGLLPFEGVPLLLFSYNPMAEAVTVMLLCLLYKYIYRMGREKQ